MVNTASGHKDIAIHHLKSTTEAYKWIHPTRKTKGAVVPVKVPTETTYRNQVRHKCSEIEDKCNQLVEYLCTKHSLDSRFRSLFCTHNSILPTLYVLIKTHKLLPGVDISTIPIDDLSVRPIVSCTNSPTGKLAWLVTFVLKPLLNHVPSHMSNIFSHLQRDS